VSGRSVLNIKANLPKREFSKATDTVGKDLTRRLAESNEDRRWRDKYKEVMGLMVGCKVREKEKSLHKAKPLTLYRARGYFKFTVHRQIFFA
jgi:hypothetical protein